VLLTFTLDQCSLSIEKLHVPFSSPLRLAGLVTNCLTHMLLHLIVFLINVVFEPQLDEDLKALPISPSKALADGIFDALAERICFSSSRFHDVFDITEDTI
jgi:hypothetical protein